MFWIKTNKMPSWTVIHSTALNFCLLSNGGREETFVWHLHGQVLPPSLPPLPTPTPFSGFAPDTPVTLGRASLHGLAVWITRQPGHKAGWECWQSWSRWSLRELPCFWSPVLTFQWNTPSDVVCCVICEAAGGNEEHLFLWLPTLCALFIFSFTPGFRVIPVPLNEQSTRPISQCDGLPFDPQSQLSFIESVHD